MQQCAAVVDEVVKGDRVEQRMRRARSSTGQGSRSNTNTGISREVLVWYFA